MGGWIFFSLNNMRGTFIWETKYHLPNLEKPETLIKIKKRKIPCFTLRKLELHPANTDTRNNIENGNH